MQTKVLLKQYGTKTNLWLIDLQEFYETVG